MGYNSTLVIMNDALHVIAEDKEFGAKVAAAVSALQLHKNKRGVDISSSGHCNAATAIETHHADEVKLIAVGGNYGEDLGYCGNYRSKPEDLLKALADRLGYRLVKKSAKRKKEVK